MTGGPDGQLHSYLLDDVQHTCLPFLRGMACTQTSLRVEKIQRRTCTRSFLGHSECGA